MANFTDVLEKCALRTLQRSALCRSRRELLNAYLLAKFGFDTAENEPCKVCPASSPPRRRGGGSELRECSTSSREEEVSAVNRCGFHRWAAGGGVGMSSQRTVGFPCGRPVGPSLRISAGYYFCFFACPLLGRSSPGLSSRYGFLFLLVVFSN